MSILWGSQQQIKACERTFNECDGAFATRKRRERTYIKCPILDWKGAQGAAIPSLVLLCHFQSFMKPFLS